MSLRHPVIIDLHRTQNKQSSTNQNIAIPESTRDAGVYNARVTILSSSIISTWVAYDE